MANAEQWVFAEDMPERLRHEIDGRWYGEVPEPIFMIENTSGRSRPAWSIKSFLKTGWRGMLYLGPGKLNMILQSRSCFPARPDACHCRAWGDTLFSVQTAVHPFTQAAGDFDGQFYSRTQAEGGAQNTDHLLHHPSLSQ